VKLLVEILLKKKCSFQDPVEVYARPLERLIGAVVSYMATNDLNDSNRDVHIECAAMLLVLCSIQMYSDQPTNSFYIFQ